MYRYNKGKTGDVDWEYYEVGLSDEECSTEIRLPAIYDIEAVAESIGEDRFADWEYVVPEFLMIRRKEEGVEHPWIKVKLTVESRPEFSARVIKENSS